jgi:hypothetical protein
VRGWVDREKGAPRARRRTGRGGRRVNKWRAVAVGRSGEVESGGSLRRRLQSSPWILAVLRTVTAVTVGDSRVLLGRRTVFFCTAG